MAVVESKLKTGRLTLGTAPGTEFSCQATNVRITPTFDEGGESQETLCGDVLAPTVTTSYALEGTSIQDFDAPGSFVEYAYTHDGETVDFTWQPNATATQFAGQVQIRAAEIGGDVNVRLTTDWSWPCAGKPTPTWPTAAPGAAEESEPADDETSELV